MGWSKACRRTRPEAGRGDGLKIEPKDGPKVYPTNWWVGMKNPELQLMIHQKDIGRDPVVRVSCPGVKLLRVHRTENPNYLFLDLLIGPGRVRVR